MSERSPHSVLQLAEDWRRWRTDPEVQRPRAVLVQDFIELFEQYEVLAASERGAWAARDELQEQLEAAEERYHAIENKALFHDDALARAKRAEEQLEALREALQEIDRYAMRFDGGSVVGAGRLARAALASFPASRPPADATPFDKPKMQQIGESLPAIRPCHVCGTTTGEHELYCSVAPSPASDPDGAYWRAQGGVPNQEGERQ